MKKTRTSTKFTFYAGAALVATAIIITFVGFYTGAINQTNIVEVLYALLLSAAAFLGINLTRVTAENLATINTAKEAAVIPPVEPVTVEATEQGVMVSTEPTPNYFSNFKGGIK